MILRTRDVNDNMKWKEYDFASFELFYIFIQKLVPICNKLKCFKSFNWKSYFIKNKFKHFYNTHTKCSLTDIRSELHCSSDKCFTVVFWTDRGWTESEAKIKISNLQKSNSSKVDAQNRCSNTQLKWWLKKGYTEDEAKSLISERQKTFTKEKCIEKYGEAKGNIVYANRQQQWRSTIDKKFSKETQNQWRASGAFFSKQSSELFKFFYEKYKNIYTCFLAPYTKEFFINVKDSNKFYLYDFCIKELKLIFEFNGSHVHANPDWPEEKLKKWRQCFTKETAKENILNYYQKILAAKEQGFDVVVIWDSEKNPKEIICREIEAKLQKLQP